MSVKVLKANNWHTLRIMGTRWSINNRRLLRRNTLCAIQSRYKVDNMVWHMPGAEYDPKEKWYNSEDCWLLFMFEHIFSIPEVGWPFYVKMLMFRSDFTTSGRFCLSCADRITCLLFCQDVIISWEKKEGTVSQCRKGWYPLWIKQSCMFWCSYNKNNS